MRFPTGESYNTYVQNPRVYFRDREIATRRVATDAMGLPDVLSGGFAYTYRFNGGLGPIAVRCFHREISDLLRRYRAISTFLKELKSRFFIDFEFMDDVLRTDEASFPAIRMEWVVGETLASYLLRQRRSGAALGRLRGELLEFSVHQASHNYAHGDLQLRNIMVTPDNRMKLVDYDGMYVPALHGLPSADQGQPHFQSPLRNGGSFGPFVDRFSLLVLDLSLEALQLQPALFDEFHQGENLILKRSDFEDPGSSLVFDRMAALSSLTAKVSLFRDLCRIPLENLSTLNDFRAGKGPHVAAPPLLTTGEYELVTLYETYASSVPVIDGMDYTRAIAFVGEQVEMVGQVVRFFRSGQTTILRFGVPYHHTPSVVFPNALYDTWSKAPFMARRPWVSVSGVLKKHISGAYTTVQVIVNELSDIEVLPSKNHAAYRLGRKKLKKTVRRIKQPTLPVPDWLNPPKLTQPQGSLPEVTKVATDFIPGDVPDWVRNHVPEPLDPVRGPRHISPVAPPTPPVAPQPPVVAPAGWLRPTLVLLLVLAAFLIIAMFLQ